MINHRLRKKLAYVIRQLGSGKITNEEYEAALPYLNIEDFSLREINSNGIGRFYIDDFNESYRLKLSKVDKKKFARMILFLHSENEYEWPVYYRDRLKIHGFLIFLFDILTFFFFAKKYNYACEEYKKCGDIEVWPFISCESYEKALKNPRFLVGKRYF